MKLLRYGPVGQEKPACRERDGKIRDLSGVLPDITAQTLQPDQLKALAATDISSLPVIDKPGRLGTPYAGLGKFICVGLNYSDHAAETGADIPKEPILFNKWSAATGPNDPVVMPRNSRSEEHTSELQSLMRISYAVFCLKKKH